jgi:hypothetical protein
MSGKQSRPCGTPGSIYETELAADVVTMKVFLPAPAVASLSEAEQAQLVADLHEAIIPTMERLYSRAWGEHFAGRQYPDHDRPFPPEHEQLFEIVP